MWKGEVPKSSAIGEWFDVKVQIGPTPAMDFLIYNKERDLQFYVNSTMCDQFQALFDVVIKFAPCQGRKAYFRA